MPTEDTTRSQIARAQRGDRQAFDALVDTHRERLLAFVHTRLGRDLCTRIEPEDLVQDALLVAFQSIDRFEWRGVDSLFNWLATIVEFRIRDLSRAVRRRPQLPLTIDPAADSVSPSKHLRREERFKRLETALDRLSGEHKEVIRLAHINKLSLEEIAERMRRTPGAVRQLLLRALEKLREHFGEETASFNLPSRSLESREGGFDA